MNYADMLIMEYKDTIYGCRFNESGDIEYYKKDENGEWVRLSTDPLEGLRNEN